MKELPRSIHSCIEKFIELASKYNLPIVLHAVYEDADIVCDLLEKYKVSRAHFHWFKGSDETMKRMMRNGYYISITPDVLHKEKIRKIVSYYPLEYMMVETDIVGISRRCYNAPKNDSRGIKGN